MKVLRRMLDGIYRAAAALAAICLGAIAVLILAQVAGRWFGVLVPSAEEFAGFLMAAATFLALAWTLRSGGHIRVTLLIRQLSPRARHAQEIVATAVLFGLAAWLTVSCTALVLESYAFGDVSGGYVPVPLWIPQLPMAMGLAILSLALLDELVCLCAGHAPSWRSGENRPV